jgi:tetratricopeptide (TPR) repeat protein
MERLLGERQREYAESIAYHFQNSDTSERAVPYLLIAGKKAIERYALAEAESHYRSAYDVLLEQADSSERDHKLLELLNEWSLLHYYTGEVDVMNRLMNEHAGLLERVADADLCGMWLTWHCFVAYCMLKAPESLAFSDRAIALAEETGSTRVLAYAYTQRAWAINNTGRYDDFVAFAEKALDLVDRLPDERDARYIRLKAGCAAAVGRLAIGDLIKSQALARELMEFAIATGSARALCFAHLASGVIAANTGDPTRSVAELKRARDAAADPFYRSTVEAWLGGFLVGVNEYNAAKALIEPALRFAEEHEIAIFSLLQQFNQAMLLTAEGEPTRGLDKLASLRLRSVELAFSGELFIAINEAIIYARMATGEAKGSLGVMLRNPGFVLGRARKASQIARDALADLSANLPPYQEGFRFLIEFDFAKLLIKRKDRDEARKHIEKAIAFLLPLGDSVGMRDAKALLATLDGK